LLLVYSKNENKIAVFIYPNPAYEFLILETEMLQLNKLYYNLYNKKGKLVKQENITKTRIALATSNLPNVNYFLSVFNE
jgi:hypothetical protein